MFKIRSMECGDLAAAFRLSHQSGWNQTLADWERFLVLQPDGCFVAVLADRVVGTVTTCEFGRVAWIGMVLVDQLHRGCGIGKALTQRAMDHLSHKGVTSIRLDATPLGERIYQKLGFVAQYRLSRFAGTIATRPSDQPSRQLQFSDIEQLLALDGTVIAYDRHRVLRRIIASAEFAACCVSDHGELDGYVLARPGHLASYIGPCIATPECGASLLTSAFEHLSGQPVMVDIPHANTAGSRLAEAAGLAPQRELLRMCLGDWVTDRVDRLWASGGPEKG